MEYYNEENCRNQFYCEEGQRKNINRKKIAGYLKKLKENGDDYKIKHIKKLYRIYNIFYQVKSLIFSKDTFEYTDKNLFTDDFYSFLIYIVDVLKADIIKFIDFFQDNDFNNEGINLDKNIVKEFILFENFNYFEEKLLEIIK